MSRRKKAQDYFVGVILVVGFVVWVLQQIWLYLLIGAATVLVTWLAVVITRKIQAIPPRPRAVPAPVSALPPQPREESGASTERHALLPIDPAVFDDAILAEGAALDVFKSWARGLPMAPRDPTILVREITLHRRQMGRLASEIVTRELVWREEPYRGHAAAVSPAPIDESADPWSRTADDFKQSSQHLIACPSCGESGSIACSTCNGRGRVQCPNCGGVGKAYGYAKNGSRRLMNCRVCGTQGKVDCSDCDLGKRRCSACQGSGRRRRWLEVIQKVRVDVQMKPDAFRPATLSWGTKAEQASAEQIKQDARILGEKVSNTVLGDSDVADTAPAPWLAEHWQSLQPVLSPNERIQRQTFWFLEVPAVDLTYSLPREQPTTLSFEGLRMLAPPTTADTALVRRAGRLRLLRYVLIAIALGVPFTYLLRGRYFASGWVAGLAGSLAIVAIALDQFLQGWTLGLARARRWGMVAAGCALLVCGFAAGAEPSLRAAHRLLAKGDLDAAKAELVALGHPEQPDHLQAWADLHVKLAGRIDTVEGIRGELEQIPPLMPQRREVAHRLFDSANGTSRQLLAAGRWQQAEAVLAVAAPPLGETPGAEPWLAQVSELRALSQEQSFDNCTTDACRLSAARKSVSLATNPVRTERLSDIRARVLESLEFRPAQGETVLARLQRVDVIAANIKDLGDQQEDGELAARIRSADELARTERAKVPLMGADAPTLGELLTATFDPKASTLHTVISSVALYAAMRSGRCVGIYMTGAQRDARPLNDAARSGTTTRLLSQAFGRDVPLPDQPVGQAARGISRSKVGSVAILGRWNGNHLIELRIGEAKP